jgi:hypothetical protein
VDIKEKQFGVAAARAKRKWSELDITGEKTAGLKIEPLPPNHHAGPIRSNMLLKFAAPSCYVTPHLENLLINCLFM